MVYCKFISENEISVYDKRGVTVGNRLIGNPTDSDMWVAGYLPVVGDVMPKIGTCAYFTVRYENLGYAVRRIVTLHPYAEEGKRKEEI